MRVTLHDICKKMGISTATVSRVLNNSPLVTKKNRLRVKEVMKELHYHLLSTPHIVMPTKLVIRESYGKP